jgi:hypothetical protein
MVYGCLTKAGIHCVLTGWIRKEEKEDKTGKVSLKKI